MRNFYVSIVLLVLIILFASLQTFWSGLVYFALSFLIILCIYWLIVLINQYIVDYYKTFEDDFKIYCNETINSTMLSAKDINDNLSYYRKKYKRSLIRDKILDITKILFIISILVSCVVGMTMV